MSSSLRTLCLALRAAFKLLASGAVGCVTAYGAFALFGASQAWAGSQSGWAPMCDLDASSVVAPLIAPPVDSGEIKSGEINSGDMTVCPAGLLFDFAQMRVLQGGDPAGGPESAAGFVAPSPRVLPVNACDVPRFAAVGFLLGWPHTQAGPRSAFERAPDRPPCR